MSFVTKSEFYFIFFDNLIKFSFHFLGNVPVFDPPRRKKFRPIAEQS